MKNINQDKPPVYYLSEAAKVIYTNISEKLKEKYDLKKIRIILELMDDYYDEIGINVYDEDEQTVSESPVVVEEEELHAYIISHAPEYGLLVEDEELTEILEAEFIYYKMIGLIIEGDKNLTEK